MNHRGISHVGLSTLDLDKTRNFYEDVLGFKPVVADTIKIEEGGYLRHLFFDASRRGRRLFWQRSAMSCVSGAIS
jgi:catechol 2,3-dioxygenase-like lactoylglutathione lyase family enzyme